MNKVKQVNGRRMLLERSILMNSSDLLEEKGQPVGVQERKHWPY